MTRLLVSLLLLQAALPAFAALTPPEQAVIKDCADNVDLAKKLLSPEAADKCVKGLNAGSPTLLNKYQQEDPAAATGIIAYNSALLDFKVIVVRQSGAEAALALYRVLEKNNCALCDLKLGPKPELAFEWVGKYASERDDAFKNSVRTWDALGDVRTKSLSAAPYSKGKESWNGQQILDRYYELGDWAMKETDKLEAASKLPGAAGKLDLTSLAGVLRSDLRNAAYLSSMQGVGYDQYLAAIKKLDEISKTAGAPAAPPKAATSDKKAKELAAMSSKFDPGGANTEANLNRVFDGNTEDAALMASLKNPSAGGKTGAGTGSAVKPITPVKMTADQEKALGDAMFRTEKGKPAGYLADVMGETTAGKHTLEFYSDPKYAKQGSNKIDFSFKREEGVFGYWNPADRNIVINSEVAEEFAAKRGMTPAQLMKDKAALHDLAVYISPTGIHEPRHQEQTAQAIDRGVDFVKFSNGATTSPYLRYMENQANKASAEHMVEYCSKHGGAACYQNFNPMHVDNVEKYMQGGVAALDALKAPLYPRIDSLDGGAAREFKSAQSYAAYLKTLEDKNRTSPKSMTAKELQDMRDYRQLMDTRFKWYDMIYQESVQDEASALAFRKKYGAYAPSGAVPTL